MTASQLPSVSLCDFATYFIMGGVRGVDQMVLSIVDTLTKFSMTPIPFFVMMGEVLYQTGLASRTLDVVSKWTGAIPGRLSVVTLMAGGLFAALSGSTVANTAMFASLMVPEMTKRGYSAEMTVGPIMGSGALAMVIPPSALAVILGSLAEVSIGGLLIAALLPGFLLLVLYLAYVITRCAINPRLAPKYEIEHAATRDKLLAVVRDLLPLGLIILMVLGLIFLGVATPTEAAALGALTSFVLAAAFRVLTWKAFKKTMIGSLKVSVMILAIIGGSGAFSQILAFSGASRELVELVTNAQLDPMVILFIMLGIVVVMGCFMEQVSIMMITIPVFMPIVAVFNFDPIWFAVLVLICLEIGQLSPPVGLALFVMKGAAPKGITMGQIYRGALPYVALDIVAVVLIVIFPAVALWLPGYIRAG